MQYVWRCQKCFRYLSHIENNSETNPITQRTICPRCKSENRITLTLETVIASCGFSKKYNSNLVNTKTQEAPLTKTLLIEKMGKEVCFSTKIIIKNNKKDS